ncbi:hypothetical protein CAAN1_02S04390 [[Candida] anglica]|uniref:Uncharacterized protein n=1 Tax=[Candida] anglica TaxID=148631 RepID=A0ABP0EDP6_9ASCO
MLQSKQISKVLSQGLQPIGPNDSRAPLALSLLSNSGVPLTTVTTSNEEVSLSANNLKICSLLAVNNFEQQYDLGEEDPIPSNDENDVKWTVLEFEESGFKAIIEKLNYTKNKDIDSLLYVVIFYRKGDFPDAIAKLKVDNVCRVLEDGLRGYHR